MDVTKVLVSLDERLLRWVDRAARAAGLSRSAYLARLAERERAELTGPGANPSVRRALTRMDRLVEQNPSPAGDSTAAVRAERDARAERNAQ